MSVSEINGVEYNDTERPTADEETNALVVEVTKYAPEGLMP